MPTWLKVVLGILVGSLVICGGVVGACAIFVKKQAADVDSSAFAKENTQDACLPEALKKVKDCDPDGILCSGKVAVWAAQCVGTAQPSGFCETIPAYGDPLSKWQQAQCESVGLPMAEKQKDARCAMVLTSVLQICLSQRDGGQAADDTANEGSNEEPSNDGDTGADQPTEEQKDKAE